MLFGITIIVLGFRALYGCVAPKPAGEHSEPAGLSSQVRGPAQAGLRVWPAQAVVPAFQGQLSAQRLPAGADRFGQAQILLPKPRLVRAGTAWRR